MSTRRIDVRIGGDDGRLVAAGAAPRPAVPVGELIYEVSGVRETAVFTYHRSWLEHPNRFALSPDLPLQDGPTFRTRSGNASALPLPVSDGAPDSWGRAIIKMAFKGDGRGRVPNDLDYLLESDDFLRSGALRYFDGPGEGATALAPPRTAERGGTVSVPRLYELDDVINASRAFEADPEGYQAERGKFVGGELIANAGSLGGHGRRSTRGTMPVNSGSPNWRSRMTPTHSPGQKSWRSDWRRGWASGPHRPRYFPRLPSGFLWHWSSGSTGSTAARGCPSSRRRRSWAWRAPSRETTSMWRTR
ncbi:MAG: type II toxin-antitoxin system HipA family toxin [Tabrizicola sp.]|nr:type II toxin-antitoxin system HipA family toxin [Tabrizicola sp.]